MLPGFRLLFWPLSKEIHKRSLTTMGCKHLTDTRFNSCSYPPLLSTSLFSLSFSFSHSLTPYVGRSMCIDIFSVYRSPESRIGDHPRNRLSHFYVLQKWSGQVLSSISLSFTGSPPFSLFHTASDKEPSRTLEAYSSTGWMG